MTRCQCGRMWCGWPVRGLGDRHSAWTRYCARCTRRMDTLAREVIGEIVGEEQHARRLARKDRKS